MLTGSCFWKMQAFMQSLQMRWPVPGSIGLSTTTIASAAIESPPRRRTCISPIFSSSGQPRERDAERVLLHPARLSCIPFEQESFSRSWQYMQ